MMDLKAKHNDEHMIIILCPFYFSPSVKLFLSDITAQRRNNSYSGVRRGLLVLKEKFKVESWHLLCNFFSNKFSLVTFSRNKDKCLTIVFQMNIALNKILLEVPTWCKVKGSFAKEEWVEASWHHWLHHKMELNIYQIV